MVMTQGRADQKEKGGWEELEQELHASLEQTNHELTEINMLLGQSQLEVNKLAQRNTSITAHLQQVQNQFDSLPRADIRMAYDAALESVQRLFVMRGQIEKLQSDRAHLEQFKSLLEQVSLLLDSYPLQKQQTKSSVAMAQSVEMMIEAQEAERQRLARKMHDEPAQALSNFILQTEIAMRLFDLDQSKAKDELANLKTAAATTFQKVRDFIFELRPMMLDDLGLTPTLNRYIEAFKEQTGLDIRVSVTGMEQRLEPYLEVMIFRAVQELVGNAARHSQASQIKVQVDAMDTDVRVNVEDNGKGFDARAAVEKGLGLKLIRDRVEMLNGEMEIDSVIGKGTRISFQIPATKTKVFA